MNQTWIIIPTYNRADDLRDCLNSLSKTGIPNQQIIVVNNASQDNTNLLVSENFPEIHLISLNENIGATGASNVGFDYALKHGADYVIRLDSDTIVAPNFISPLLDLAKSDSNIGMVSPKIYYYDSPKEIWYAGADAKPVIFGTKNEHNLETDSPNNSQIKEVAYIWATAMLIKREVLEKTGGFDTDFFIYHEEIDFCERVRSLGYRLLFNPNSYVWHKIGSNLNNSWTAYHWNRSKMLLYRKHARNNCHKIFLIFYAFSYAFTYALLNFVKLKKKNGNRGPLKDAIRGLSSGLRL